MLKFALIILGLSTVTPNLFTATKITNNSLVLISQLFGPYIIIITILLFIIEVISIILFSTYLN